MFRWGKKPRIVTWIDLVLFFVLSASGLWVITYPPFKFEEATAAALAGAMFGSAALLLGNWINRSNERYKAESELIERVEKLKELIAAELVDVASGLLSAKQYIDAVGSTGTVIKTLDLSGHQPRLMLFTNSLGTELLTLEKSEIDALATLRSNLALTRQAMNEITASTNVGLLKVIALSVEIGHDMAILSEVFEHIAPKRKLQMMEKEPELATEILNRAAKPPADHHL